MLIRNSSQRILLYLSMLYRSLDNSDDGVDNFYPTSPPQSNNASAGSTPLTGSPVLDGGPSPLPSASTRSSGGIFSHLKSSRSKNVSKEYEECMHLISQENNIYKFMQPVIKACLIIHGI